MDIGEYLSKTINMYFGKVEEGYNYVNKNVGLWDSIIVYFLLALISIIVSTITDITSYQQFGANIVLLMVGVILFSLIILPIAILIGYGLIHLFLKIFGGKASFAETIKFAISASIFSIILGTITSGITNILISNVQNIAFEITYTIVMLFISLAIAIWALIVLARTLGLAHKISTGKALIAIILPAIILIGAAFVIAFIAAILVGIAVF